MMSQRLSSKYLLLSLAVALIPLISFAALYNYYTMQLVSQITDEQLATRMAATQNEMRVFLRERGYEIAALADQFTDPGLFEHEGSRLLSIEMEDLLRLQTDDSSIYGIAFFGKSGELSWTFPDDLVLDELNAGIIFEGVVLSDPSTRSWEHPPYILMKSQVNFHGRQVEAPSIGLIIRFNSITEMMKGLDQPHTYRSVLRVSSGQTYDVVGQPIEAKVSSFQREILPGWSLHLLQNHGLVSTPIEQMRIWLIVLVVCTVVGLLLLHFNISRKLNQQVDSIVKSVEQVAAGDLDSPVKQSTSLEMDKLAKAIDTMRMQLKGFITSTLEIERRASLGQLAAGLAHDIRNPLTTIKTTIVALTKREKDLVNRDMLNMLEDEIDRMNDVIENLLDYARPREPKAELLNLSELLESMATLLSASARENNVTIRIECPAATEVWIDDGQLRQVLMNLMLNAIQAVGRDGGNLLIRCTEKFDCVDVIISDSGTGIPKDVMPHIIEPFFTTKSAGTGLGLAICNALIHNNNGQLIITSKEGQGTTVSLQLPKAIGGQSDE